MRNPKWQHDELILALDLYFDLNPGQIHAKNPQIIELSKLLNKLPIHGNSGEFEDFRNPNGVGLKLSNFLSLDKTYIGKGMSSTSKLDKELFEKYEVDRELLRKLAEAIRFSAHHEGIRSELLSVTENFEETGFAKAEGNILYRYHLYRERNSSLVNKKKQLALKLYGKLECELCSFNYEKNYGSSGSGFMECHHKKPLYTLTEETKTTLDDLMLVCANCHRMLHRGWVMGNRKIV